MTIPDLATAREVLRLRLSQQLINEKYKQRAFRVPIHLAMGHEAIAVALAGVLGHDDRLALSHRNIHYNLAFGATLRQVVDEFLLDRHGLAGGKFGSMNLINPGAGLVYTSSILGNNLGVAAGLALGGAVLGEPGLTCVVTGDGAMEEGAFYELLVVLCGERVPALVIVENNGWSLASMIDERRAPIDLAGFSASLGAGYCDLAGNDVFAYRAQLKEAYRRALHDRRPIIVEAALHTLGHWRQPTPEFPDGKYINYHAGPAPTTEAAPWPLMDHGDDDPVHVLLSHFPEEMLRAEAMALFDSLRETLP